MGRRARGRVRGRVFGTWAVDSTAFRSSAIEAAAQRLLGIWATAGEMVPLQGGGGRGLLCEPGQNP